MPGTVLSCAYLLASFGIGTHIPYTDGGYANLGNVAADLAYIGLTNVRDGISNGVNGSAPLSSYVGLAQKGIKFTFLVSAGGTVTTDSLLAELGLIDQVNLAVPGGVVAVEGANEINNFPMNFNGVWGLQGAVDLQTALFAAVHADASLPGVSVDYFTGYAAGGIPMGPDPATSPGLADYDNQHPYPNAGQAPLAWVTPAISLPNEAVGSGPSVFTETGYSTNGGTTGAVNADVQAKYTLDLLLDDAKNGVSTTYLYQLLDAYAPGSRQGDEGFGLFTWQNRAKPSAFALHNLTRILHDYGANAGSFTPAPLDYSLYGLPATGNSLVVENSSGIYYIIIWNEPQIWDEQNGSEVATVPVIVSVQLGAFHKGAWVFDPLVARSAVSFLANVNSVNLTITDHPIVLQLSHN